MCGGSFLSSLASGAKSAFKAVAKSPALQNALLSTARTLAPGLTSQAEGLYHQGVNTLGQVAGHPLGAMALKQVGLGHKHGGRRTRPPTAHSLAVKRVMSLHGLPLGQASKYVKEHGVENV